MRKDLETFFNNNNDNRITAKKLNEFLAVKLNSNMEQCEVVSNILGTSYLKIKARFLDAELKTFNKSSDFDNKLEDLLEDKNKVELFFYSAENLLLEEVFLKYDVRFKIDNLKSILRLLKFPFISFEELFPLLDEFVKNHERFIEENAGLENEQLFLKDKSLSVLKETHSSTDCLVLKKNIELYAKRLDL